MGGFLHDSDFLCFAETWASNVKEFVFSGFNQVCTICKKMANAISNSGGISFYYKTNLNISVEKLTSISDNILWVKMSLNDGIALIVCTVYRSPQNLQFATDENIHEILKSEYLDYHLCFSDFKFIIVGDFNGRTGIENDFIEGDKSTDSWDPNAYDEDEEMSKRNNSDQI